MVEYDLDWLKKKGFFRKSIPLKVKGKEILVDKKNLLAYVEVFSNEEIEEIKRALLSQKIRYIWFFFPAIEKLKVFRRIGEVKWFYYSARMRSDYLKSRIDKLNKFSPDNMNILFDIRDIVEKFYWQLWEHRILMARSIRELKEDKNKLLAVQHLIDRLIFFYFLAQLKLVKVKNEEREWVLDRKNTREFFKWICDQLSESDLQKFLNKMFFDVLGQVNESGFVSEEFVIRKERFSIVSPCLNGGLFIEEKIEEVPEGRIEISGIKKLILEVLNNYNWIIGEEFPEEEDVIGDLTPEIIGHIYEKFVVSLEQIGIGKIKLKDVRTVKENLRYGRKKIGAYYTPEEITNYISMNTIYPYIQDRIYEKFKIRYKNIQKELLEKKKFTRKELEIIKHLYFEILTKMRICDNACGSGSFLIAAGDVLLRLYSRVLKILGDNLSDNKEIKEVLKDIRKSPTRNYYIVRQIIVSNLYGVDIMEGAVEIAKLRFWLWLISQVDPRRVEGKRIETLPNLDFNLMVGNSLIGFVDIESVEFNFIPVKPKKRWKNLKTKQYLITTWTDKDKVKWLKELAKQKQKFKTLPAHEAVKLKKKLNKELEKAREFLNEKFYNMLKAKGIKISKEEFLKLKPFHWGFEFYEVFDLEKPKEERGFDVIIGNPPYVNIRELTKSDLKSKEIYSSLYSSAKGLYDILVIFIERSIGLMKSKAYFCYIVSNKFTVADYGLYIRRMILNQTKLKILTDVSHIQVFKDAGVYPIILSFMKEKSSPNNLIRIENVLSLDKLGKTTRFVKEKVFIEDPKNIFIIGEFPFDTNILTYIEMKSQKLNEIGLLHSGTTGFEYENWGKLIRTISSIRRHRNYCKFIITGNIKRYCIDESKKVRYQGKILENPILVHDNRITSGKWKLFKSKKIVIRGIAKRLTCALDNIGYALGVSVYAITDLKYDPRLVLILINSKLVNFYYKQRFISKHLAGGYIGYNKGQLEQIPIKLPPTQKPFIIFADYMLFLNATEERRTKEKELIEFIDRKIIDSLVYELYLKEKFEQDGIKTNLLELVEPYLKDIFNLNSDEQKLQTIKKVIEKIKNDKKIMEQIEKIKSHPWIRIIEGEGE